MVDVRDGLIQLPVREQLLVRACEADSWYDGTDEVTCDIGLVSFEYDRFVRLRHLKESKWSCPQFAWSPDGTQFAYYSHGMACWNGYTSAVYRADGGDEHHIPSAQIAATAIWSTDGQYFVMKSCQTGHDQPGHRWTVYDVSTWTVVCQVGWSHPMGPCIYDVTDSGLELTSQCTLPLADGREWILSTSQAHDLVGDLTQKICSNSADCLIISQLDVVSTTKELESYHYQVSLNDNQLRVTDNKSGDARTYSIPGYVITTIAWAPIE